MVILLVWMIKSSIPGDQRVAKEYHLYWFEEQRYKWVGHYIFTQNFKALGSKILSHINCSTSTFLNNVRLDSLHTCRIKKGSKSVYILCKKKNEVLTSP
jgi:hypothetical protein